MTTDLTVLNPTSASQRTKELGGGDSRQSWHAVPMQEPEEQGEVALV
ncbi:MAG TPA: hypothetical protein VGW38_28570 [Chloroflexota bacterium]|nr:hypothetical protein [Chloroflexota bacterium]